MIKDEFKSKLFDVLKTFHETMLRHSLSKWETDMTGRNMYSLIIHTSYYADGYIVFVFPFVCSSNFCVKVS